MTSIWFFFFLMIRRPPRSTLFPYTTSSDLLRRATRLLRGGCDVVLAPAEDGGYALIGARRVSRRLFDGIAWSESGVYAQTAERLLALGYRWCALRSVWDVDRPADLERLRSLRLPSAQPPAFRR